jgi:hypothetical protein
MGTQVFGHTVIARELMHFAAFAVFGLLSVILLRHLTRTLIAGLFLLIALVIANALGLSWFNPDFLWNTIEQVVTVLPSLKELAMTLLRQSDKPVLATGFLVGLLMGLLGFRS